MIFPAIAGVGLAAGAGLLAWAVRGRSSQLLAPSIWKGPTDRKVIALTFDDGPSESTPRILELLAQYDAKATFFQVGKNVERLPEICRQVIAAGCEVGNHSFTHPRFNFTSGQFQMEELSQTQAAIGKACGVTPRWFRAPYGVRWFGLGGAQQVCGLEGVTWTVIALDWKLTATAIQDRMLQRAENGAIFCFHDGRRTNAAPDIGATIAAMAVILPELRRRGYELVTLSQMMNRFPS